MNLSENNQEQELKTGPKPSLGSRMIKGLLKGAFYATIYPLTIGPHKLSYKAAKTGIELSDTWKGKTSSVLGGIALSACFASAQIYGGLYATVAAGDALGPHTKLGSSAHTTMVGQITKFTHKGFPPCDTWEGDLLHYGNTNKKSSIMSSLTTPFSVRRLDFELRKKIEQAQTTGDIVSIPYDESWWDAARFEKIPFSCIQGTNNHATDVTVLTREQAEQTADNIPAAKRSFPPGVQP